MKKIGIIFDMDGTLWDSSQQVADSWNMGFADFSDTQDLYLTKEDLMSHMGKPMDALAYELLPSLSKKRALEIMDHCCQVENDYLAQNGGLLYEGLANTMKKLHELGYHTYIVSNCQSGYIEAFLKYYSFEDLFEDHSCFGDNQLQKDENIRLVCDRNQVDYAIYVGDILADYNSACKAGVDFILAEYGFGQVENVPKIDSLSELPACIQTLLASN